MGIRIEILLQDGVWDPWLAGGQAAGRKGYELPVSLQKASGAWVLFAYLLSTRVCLFGQQVGSCPVGRWGGVLSRSTTFLSNTAALPGWGVSTRAAGSEKSRGQQRAPGHRTHPPGSPGQGVH